MTIRSEKTEPAEVAAGREGAIYVDPYTGTVLGPGSRDWRSFFQKVTAWHRWLGAEGEGRATAKAITGACNLAFLGLVVTGAYLWLPKQWTRQHVAPITWFRRSATAKARDFNWHNVFGIWAVIPLFFVVLTAVPMSYSWANDLIYRITGTEPQGPGGAGKGGGKGGGKKGARKGPPPETAEAPSFEGLNQVWARAESHTPGWRSIGMRLPESPKRPVVFTIDSGDGGQPQSRATLTLDRATTDVVRKEDFASFNAGRRLRSWSRFVHTGEAFGFIGQTIAGIASACAVMLVWTGISLALRRFSAWRRRTAPQFSGATLRDSN